MVQSAVKGRRNQTKLQDDVDYGDQGPEELGSTQPYRGLARHSAYPCNTTGEVHGRPIHRRVQEPTRISGIRQCRRLALERPDNLPGLKLAMRRHPGLEHGELARSYCLARWRAEVEESFLVERVPGPLLADTVVMGAQLARGPVSYSAPGSGSWLLLKCSDPGPFFIGFDSATGEAEMFPRRFDSDGYAFAIQLLRVIA